MSGEVTITGWAKLGGLVRDTRLSRGLTQAEVASRAGVARSWLSRVETGHRGAELEPLLKLLAALDLSLTLRSNDPSSPPSRARTAEAHAVPDAGHVLRAAAEARRAAWGVPATTPGTRDGA